MITSFVIVTSLLNVALMLCGLLREYQEKNPKFKFLALWAIWTLHLGTLFGGVYLVRWILLTKDWY